MLGGTLGPYRLDRELGAGGMGKVWAARVEGRVPGLDVGEVVALKVVHPHLLETPGFFQRFLREAEIGRAVAHDNVVRTIGCDQVIVDGRPQSFLVMEYVEGQTLRGLLDELERVPEELCRHIGREVAKGLAAIHAAGVVHRDMKPDNVVITRDHAVKVMDLGVARLHDEALRLSQTGAFVGSLHYAAPESFREGGRHVDGRADLHALGLVLYELACGVNPYFADSVPETLKKVLHETPRRLGDVNPQLSPFFEEVVHTLLAKEPAARFADASALVAVLEDGEKSTWWTSRSQAIRAETHRPLRRIRIPRETAVYGRDAELSTLRRHFDLAKSGEGQVVLIEGEAGIGKSRLVDELVGRLQRGGEDLEFLYGSYPPGGAATAAGAFSTAFREQLGADGVEPYLTETPLLVPAFDALLRGDATPTGAEPLTRTSIAACFVQVLRVLAAGRTTVLLVDDLHFASEDSRAMFLSIAMAVPGHRVLLVGTTRPGIDEKWLAGLTRLPQTSQIAVGRLGPKDLALLLADSFRSEDLAARLGHQIAVKSDGNPFFAFEIVRGLREGQFIRLTDDGTWVTTRVVDDIRIPSSVLDLVRARVADLSAEERDLLDVAACWGFEFDATLVGDALGLPRVPTLKRFAQVEKKHRLVRCVGERFAFDHHQVQEALYGALPPQLAREYHAALAGALESRSNAAEGEPEHLDGSLCVDLCEHFLEGSQGERALRYLGAAQVHLWKGYLHAQEIALTERALAVPGLLAGAPRARSLLRLAGSNGPLELLGRRARQEEFVLEAARLAEQAHDDELRGHAADALGLVLWSTSRLAEAEVSFGRAIEFARACGNRTLEADATLNLGNVYQYQRRIAETQERFERSLDLAREIGDAARQAAATINLGSLFWTSGRPDEAQERLEQGLALARASSHRRWEANATLSLGNVARTRGRIAEAMRHYERALGLARDIGDRRGELAGLGNLGVCLHSQGRLAEARQHCERVSEICREIGDRPNEAISMLQRAAVARDEGDLPKCGERLLRGLAICEEVGIRFGAAHTRLALGSLRVAAGDEERGRADLAAALDLARELRIPDVEALARCELALLPGGDPADALRACAEHEGRLDSAQRRRARLLLFRATGDRAHLAEAKRLLDESTAQADEETRALMLTKLHLNREIVAAARAQGL